MAGRYEAELLAANLAVAMDDRDIDAVQLDTLARLDADRARRMLTADVEAFPCPSALHRIALALRTTTVDLLADEV